MTKTMKQQVDDKKNNILRPTHIHEGVDDLDLGGGVAGVGGGVAGVGGGVAGGVGGGVGGVGGGVAGGVGGGIAGGGIDGGDA